MNYRIYPPQDMLQASVSLPLSKSVSNRALIISALAENPCEPAVVAECSDTAVMKRALQSVGSDSIDVADAGTAMRFLTAYFAVSEGRSVRLDGTERMRHRPIGPLVEALRGCGAEIEYAGEEGFPPLVVHGRRLSGGDLHIDATVSSQFVSALLMAAPLMEEGLRLTLDGEAASLPYIDLTLSMMEKAGAKAERTVDVIEVRPGSYTSPEALTAEKDWSAAAFWYEVEALTCGFMTLEGLDLDSRQPDRRVADLFSDLGVTTTEGEESPEDVDLCGSPDSSPRFVADFASTPDLVPATVVTCAMNGIPFRLTGLQSLRIKECDRLAALSAELRKVGVETETEGDHTLIWNGRRHPVFEMPVFETYGDHRMAMAFAPVSAYLPGIVVKDAEVVGKSYPGFWEDLQSAGFTLEDADAAADQQETEEE